MSDTEETHEEEYDEAEDFFFDDEYKGERLFFVAAGSYVQYSGEGDYPPEVQQRMEANGGDLPPFMPLPSRKVEFHVDEEWGGRYAIPWPGHGPLPEPVIHYVAENGVLPRNTAIHPEV
jgi:hypothetical protein